MDLDRCSGILVHPTSLPSPHGIGDLGSAAYRFIDFLEETKQSLWQVLPLGPTGYGDSPYASFSSYAGNPLLIDPGQLVVDGDLERSDLADRPGFPTGRVDYGPVIAYKTRLLRQAYSRFRRSALGDRRGLFEQFCSEKSAWLDDYALFMALKDAHGGAAWNTWEMDLVRRDPSALARCRVKLWVEVQYHQYTQFIFYLQWMALRAYANQKQIKIVGDIPIFVALDSADAWSQPQVFHFDRSGQPTVVAGVPPDYFSPTGQRWGNPLYRWDVMARDGYQWWIDRVQAALELADILRIDHFRGFDCYWEIPASEPTAVKGQWVPGPGEAFFDALADALGGDLPIIAEDLGMITQEVRQLRQRVGLPGMKVLQFAFDGDPDHEYLPHNYTSDYVVYLGTHDNDTTLGWFRGLAPKERSFCRRYVGRDRHDVVRALMHLAFMSVADIAVLTVQDLLGLGSEARMNTPGTPGGNWQWRYQPGALTAEVGLWLEELTQTFGRAAEKEESKVEEKEIET